MVGDMSTHQTANATGRFYSTTRTSTRVCSWPALLSPNVVSFYAKFRSPYGGPPSSWKFHVCICSQCPYTTSWGPLRLDKTVWSGHTIWGNLKIRAALNARIAISGSPGAHEGAPAERVSPHTKGLKDYEMTETAHWYVFFSLSPLSIWWVYLKI